MAARAGRSLTLEQIAALSTVEERCRFLEALRRSEFEALLDVYRRVDTPMFLAEGERRERPRRRREANAWLRRQLEGLGKESAS